MWVPAVIVNLAWDRVEARVAIGLDEQLLPRNLSWSDEADGGERPC